MREKLIASNVDERVLAPNIMSKLKCEYSRPSALETINLNLLYYINKSIFETIVFSHHPYLNNIYSKVLNYHLIHIQVVYQ